MKFVKHLHSLLYNDIIRRKKVTPFIIFIFFLLSFFIARMIVYLFPKLNLFIFKYHIHHFYYGIALLVISNWVALVSDDRVLKRISAALFGVGLGLIADEIGIIITCGTAGIGCNPLQLYWSRISYDIVIYIVLIFLNIIFLGPFWYRFHKRITNLFRRKQ